MKKNNVLLITLIILSIPQTTLTYNYSSINQEASDGWIRSGINKMKTLAAITASTMWGITTGIALGYTFKAGINLLQTQNALSPQTGSAFTLLALGAKYQESSLRNNLIKYLTQDMHDYHKKSLIENFASAGSYLGLLLVGANPSGILPFLSSSTPTTVDIKTE
jgi:hypothetical protein